MTHVPQQALQATLTAQCRELMATTPTCTQCSGHGGVVQTLIDFPTMLFILVSLGLLHPKEEPLGPRLKLEHVDPPAGALRHPLELTVIGKDDQVILHGPRGPVFPTEVNEGVVRLLDVHKPFPFIWGDRSSF